MKMLSFLLSASALLGACSRLGFLTTESTAESWLASHSWIPVRIGQLEFILAELCSSIIMYALAIVLTITGLLILKNRGKDRAMLLCRKNLPLKSTFVGQRADFGAQEVKVQ